MRDGSPALLEQYVPYTVQQFAPHAVYVPRKGEVNAWDNEDFVKTVRATEGRH